MVRRIWIWGPVAASCALIGLVTTAAIAADHNEAPGTRADPAADIDDVYVWHDGAKIVAVLTFGGPGGNAAAAPAEYDADVLYGIHIDSDADHEPNQTIWARFGQASDGSWGLQLTGVPGATGVIEGPVETDLAVGTGLMARAGVFDDPFFFDLTGFQTTLQTAAVSFDPTRDSFAGKNVNAIVVEMDSVAARGGSDSIRVWATTSRK